MRFDDAGVPQVRVNMRLLTPFQVIQQIVADVEDVFVDLDLDHDGRLDVEDTFKAIFGLRYSFNGEQASQLIAEMDEDGDGFVTLKELKRRFSPPYGSSAIWSAFVHASIKYNH
ncbi:predicted protein [Arabidopsis lyrata subsp. lyrata]|uniref:Predicted protein n=1 Tax=Arabidopsis lyrata subsp. lyrata TaxID=81972 RepID=D7KQ13_ARALL|nr:predicted protein [Arabidopsis lyrata subsp. lyrata]